MGTEIHKPEGDASATTVEWICFIVYTHCGAAQWLSQGFAIARPRVGARPGPSEDRQQLWKGRKEGKELATTSLVCAPRGTAATFCWRGNQHWRSENDFNTVLCSQSSRTSIFEFRSERVLIIQNSLKNYLSPGPI